MSREDPQPGSPRAACPVVGNVDLPAAALASRPLTSCCYGCCHPEASSGHAQSHAGPCIVRVCTCTRACAHTHTAALTHPHVHTQTRVATRHSALCMPERAHMHACTHMLQTCSPLHTCPSVRVCSTSPGRTPGACTCTHYTGAQSHLRAASHGHTHPGAQARTSSSLSSSD